MVAVAVRRGVVALSPSARAAQTKSNASKLKVAPSLSLYPTSLTSPQLYHNQHGAVLQLRIAHNERQRAGSQSPLARRAPARARAQQQNRRRSLAARRPTRNLTSRTTRRSRRSGSAGARSTRRPKQRRSSSAVDDSAPLGMRRSSRCRRSASSTSVRSRSSARCRSASGSGWWRRRSGPAWRRSSTLAPRDALERELYLRAIAEQRSVSQRERQRMSTDAARRPSSWRTRSQMRRRRSTRLMTATPRPRCSAATFTVLRLPVL